MLGTEEERDQNRFPFVLASVRGSNIVVACFRNDEEARNWSDDCDRHTTLVEEVNQYADTPRHRAEFIQRVIPLFASFLQQWGVDKVPQDIRSSIADGYAYFGIEDPPVFPSDDRFILGD